MNKKSFLYAEITWEQIQFLYNQAFQVTTPVTATLLSGGLFNTTYRVTCEEIGLDTVLRLGPVNRHLLLRFENHLMKAEEYVYKLCKEQGIVCSNVFVCDTSRKWIDRDFMIVTYIPSVVLCDSGLTGERKRSIYSDVGRQAKKMHQITNQTFGRVSEILSGMSFSSWFEYLLSEIDDICGRIVSANGMKQEELAKVRQVMTKYQSLLDDIKIPRLVHTDLWEGNILLDEQEKTQLAAVIDSDRAIFGDPDYDLACPWMTNDAFLTGYEIEKNSFHNEEFNSGKRKTRRKIYNMSYHLLDAYVNLCEYNNMEEYKSHLNSAFSILKELDGLSL